MSWLKKLFGGAHTPADDYRPGVVDFRSDEERQMERGANRPLSGVDESAARSLCRLAAESQRMGDAQFNEMKRIGEQLYTRGGHTLMQRVCYRVKALGGSYT